MDNISKVESSYSNLRGGGGHRGGGGRHGGGGGRRGGRGGFRGGWGGGYLGYPYYLDYPYYWDSPYEEVLLTTNEDEPVSVKKKEKKYIIASADGDTTGVNPLPRPINPSPVKPSGLKLSQTASAIGNHALWAGVGAGVGVAVAYFAKKDMVFGAGIGAAIGTGVSFISIKK